LAVVEIDVQQRPFMQPQNLTWWQKILAVLGICASLVIAAVVGVLILYILLFILAIAFLIGAYLYVRWRFFPPTGTPPRQRQARETITVIETPEGIVVDMPANDQNSPRGGQDGRRQS